MDAMSLLREDHQRVKKMFSEVESTTERGVKTRDELFTKVKQKNAAADRPEPPAASLRQPGPRRHLVRRVLIHARQPSLYSPRMPQSIGRTSWRGRRNEEAPRRTRIS